MTKSREENVHSILQLIYKIGKTSEKFQMKNWKRYNLLNIKQEVFSF